MNKKTFSTLALAALLLTACQNDEETMQTDIRVALQVTSGIQTRAYDATWEENDPIGIFGYTQTETPMEWSNNIQYVTVTGDGTFAPAQGEVPIYLPIDGTAVDFVAYYPYTKTLADGVYTVDVTDQSNQAAIDLMAAGTQTADRINNDVAFNFEHKLSKIDITFKAGDGMTDTELAGMTVQLTGQQTAATLDVTQPESTVSVTTGNVATLTLNTTADGKSAEGIVLPSENCASMALHLVLADGSSFFDWNLYESKAKSFEAGKKYVYAITVNKTRLDVTATITDWAPGNGEDGEQGNAY